MDASEIIRRNKQKAIYTNLLQQVNLQQGCVAGNCSTTSECIFRFPTYENMENYYGGEKICDNCCATASSSSSTDFGLAVNFTTTLDSADNLYVVGGFVSQYKVFDINNNSPSPHSPPITLTNAGQGIYLVKYNSSGIVQWATQMNFTFTLLNLSIISAPWVTTDGTDIYVSGRCGAIMDFYNATDGSTFITPAAIGATINTTTLGLANNLFIARYSGSTGALIWVNQVTGAGSQTFPAGYTLTEIGVKYSPQIGSPAPILFPLTALSTVSFYNSWTQGTNTSNPIITYPNYRVSNANQYRSFMAYMTSAGTISSILQLYALSNNGISYRSTIGNVFINDVDQGSNGYLYLAGRAVNRAPTDRMYIGIDMQAFSNATPTAITTTYASTVDVEYQNMLLQFNGSIYTLARSQVTQAQDNGGSLVKVLPGTTDVVVAGSIASGRVELYNASVNSAPTEAKISTVANFGSWYTYLYKYSQIGVAQWITQLGVVGSGNGGNGLSYMTADSAANIYLAGGVTASTVPYSWSNAPTTQGVPVSTGMPVISYLGAENSNIGGYIAQYSTNGNFLQFSKTNGSSLNSTIFTLTTGNITTSLQGGLAISSSTLVYGVGGIIVSADFYKFSTVNNNTSFLTLSTTNTIAPYVVRYTFT